MPRPTTAGRVRLQRRPDFGSPVMYQTWRDLIFYNWAVAPEVVQAELPQGLYVDEFDKQAWISVMAFWMQGLHLRNVPPIPGLNSFPVLTLRTYVYDDLGSPGIWFFSLDTSNWLAVTLARRFYHLPLCHSSIDYKHQSLENSHRFHAKRKCKHPVKTSFKYRSGDELELPQPNSLQFFLTERYQLFCPLDSAASPSATRIHHKPYPLFEAETLDSPQWGVLAGTPFANLAQEEPKITLYSDKVHVEVFGRQNAVTRKKALEKDLGFSGYPETAFIGKIPNSH